MGCDHRKALDMAKNGQWDDAHHLVQNHSDKLSCLIHGYLHRIEGDLGNARYWYRRAGAEMPGDPAEDELNRLYGLLEDS